MKKIFGLLVILGLSTGLFAASSGFGSLSKNLKSLDGTKVSAATAELAEGRELFPIVWKWTHNELSVGGKVVGAQYSLDEMNVFDDTYQITTEVYMKGLIGQLVCQKSVLEITCENNTVSVLTKEMYQYNCDKNLDRTGDIIEEQKSAMNTQAKSFADGFANDSKNLSDEEYNTWSDAAYYNIETQLKISKYAANKLKAKKWYEKHSLVGKTVEFTMLFTDLKESKTNGFEYEAGGLYGLTPITVLSNNDDYIDLKSESNLKIKGVVKDVHYSGDYDTKYEIKWIIIEEQ